MKRDWIDWALITGIVACFSMVVLSVSVVAYKAAYPDPVVAEKNRAVCFDFKGNLSLNIKENNIHYTTDGIEWGDEKGKYKLFVPATGMLCSIVKEG